MNNLFDTDNYPDTEPASLVAGDWWAWTRSDITEAYPTASYTLKYRLTPLDGVADEITITAGKVSSAHVVEVSQATTTAYKSDEYGWKAIVVRDSDSEEVTVDQGYLTVHPELGATAGTHRSWVYETLAAVRATIKGTASEKQAAYSVGGRSLSLRTPQELMDMERDFSRRWDTEKAKIDRENGRSTGSRVLVKMSA